MLVFDDSGREICCRDWWSAAIDRDTAQTNPAELFLELHMLAHQFRTETYSFCSRGSGCVF